MGTPGSSVGVGPGDSRSTCPTPRTLAVRRVGLRPHVTKLLKVLESLLPGEDPALPGETSSSRNLRPAISEKLRHEMTYG
jgi:hypothetical protein